MKILIAIVAALAAVTFPIYFIVYTLQALALGIMAVLVSVIWGISQLCANIKFTTKKNNTHNISQLRR